MESFYGGRQGISFIIVKRFDGIDIPQPENIEENHEKASFTVKYFAFDIAKDNFILDDNNSPIEKNHITSKIYQDWKMHETDGSSIVYNDKEGKFPIAYAEGMIQCFSQGGMSTNIVNYGEYVIIDTPNKNDLDNGKIYRRGLDFQNELAGAEYIGQIVGPQGNAPDIIMDSFTTLVEQGGPQFSYEKDDSIPGMVINEDDSITYNDSIKSSWITIKDKFGIVTSCKIGFQFPYHVFSLSAESTDPYLEGELASRIDDMTHPYFSEWKFLIPKGVKGDSLSNLRIVNGVAKSGAKYYSDINCENEEGTLSEDKQIKIENENYTLESNKGKPFILNGDDINSIKYVKAEDTYREVLIYMLTNFDKKEAKTSFIFLGEYNIIKDIILEDDGTLRVEYTYKDEAKYEKAIKWIKEIILGQDGKIQVKYNNEDDFQIINENSLIKWINNIQLTNNGEIKVKYNTDPELIENEDGELVPFEGNSINIDDKIRWINYDSNTEDFGIKINTNEYSTDLDEDGNEIGDLGEGSGSQKIQVTYNTGETHEIGKPLNYIIECVVTHNPSLLSDRYKEDGRVKAEVPKEGHLLVIYSDPKRREGNNCLWPSKKMNQEDEGYFNGWTDLGIAKGDPGTIKIITTYPTETIEQIIAENKTPEELFGDKHEGWLIGEQNSEDEPVILYYYNYTITNIGGVDRAIGWKKLGAITAEDGGEPKNIIDIQTSTEKENELKENGILLIQKNETDHVITGLVKKNEENIADSSQGFSNMYYFNTLAKYINPTLNAGVSTLEEQLLIGFNTITEEWIDALKNIHVETKFIQGNEEEYYILHSTIFNTEKEIGNSFEIVESTLNFNNNQNQTFENYSLIFNNNDNQIFSLEEKENGEKYYSLNLNSSNSRYNSQQKNGIGEETLVKEDVLSLYKNNNKIDIYKKQVTIQFTIDNHKITKEKVINLIND